MNCVVLTSNKEYETVIANIAKLLENQGFSTKIFQDQPDQYEKFILENYKKSKLCAIDLVTADLVTTKNENRLTATALANIPQIISVLGLESYQNNGERVSTSPEKLDVLGKTIVERASASNAATLIILPKISDNKTDALYQSIRNWVYPPKLLAESEFLVFDNNFGAFVCSKLLSLTNN
jgi:hypothetical protein